MKKEEPQPAIPLYMLQHPDVLACKADLRRNLWKAHAASSMLRNVLTTENATMLDADPPVDREDISEVLVDSIGIYIERALAVLGDG